MGIAYKIKTMMEQSSWIRKMFETGAQLKAQHGTEAVCDFSLGNPNLDPPPALSKALEAIIKKQIPQKHAYMPNAGYPEVRKAVAQYVTGEYGVQVQAEQIVMTCGAGGALNVVFKTILNSGDNILVSTPCFMEYKFYVDNHGGKLILVPGQADFDLNIKALASRINKQTAGIIINSPNNPSGRVYPQATIKALSQMLTQKSREIGRPIYLISDEPYRKIVYDGIQVPSIFQYYPNSIIATSFSKDLSISGERIGWLALHPEAEANSDLMNGFILCNRILGYVNAPALMQRTIATLLNKSVDVSLYKNKRDRLCSELEKLGYEFMIPQGTFYLFPKAPEGDDVQFVNLLQKELILTVPGSGFGTPGYFRIAFCVADSVIENSIKGFARVIKKMK